MILKRFYNDKLAQASFLTGCTRTGEAAVIDPNRDIAQYLEAAAAEGLRIVAVTETHIHADFVSGSRELAERTRARLFLSDEGDADWKYGFADQPNVTLICDGDTIRVGNVRLDVMATPGHTPEHVTFILTDEPACSDPLGAFTGDFIFVGDVGRPDLLERAAGFEGTMERGAQTLFQSLTQFKKRMPDTLLIWPSHGSGSACGKSLGGVPVSTLGYECKANWALRCEDEAEFVRTILSGQPEPPAYFKEMKRINKMGPDLLGGFKQPVQLLNDLFLKAIEQDDMIVDLRSIPETANALLPQAINIPMGKGFTNWAGSLLPYGRSIFLLARDGAQAAQAAHDLQMIGLDDIQGWFETGALTLVRDGLERIAQISAGDAYEGYQSGELEIIDVRSGNEYTAGHIPGVPNIPLSCLRTRLDEISRERPLVIHCQGGVRSPICLSLLRRHGFTNLINLPGGFYEYSRSGLPVQNN